MSVRDSWCAKGRFDYHVLKQSVCVTSSCRGGEDQGIYAVTNNLCVCRSPCAL